jgi:hypothetical protein
VRRFGASWREIFRGPFQPSQLFAMPTANVVGAYQLRLFGDASLLAERNVLSTSSVAALGFGDLAQLEYRQTAAVSRSRRDLFGLPSLGVQFEAPLRERRYVPRLGLALRFGLPHRDEAVSAAPGTGALFDERATDLYLVASLPLPKVGLHLGTRITAASISATSGSKDADLEKTLVLPALGISYAVSNHSALLLEASMIPRFEPPANGSPGSITSDPYGRTGVRWEALPWLTVNASVGYHVEIKRQRAAPGTGIDALVDWDVRLGGELAIPWGAVVCRSLGIFCS